MIDQPSDQLDRYLRRLARWAPRDSRQGLLLEARRHLYDATLRAEQAGLTRAEAQCAAIAAFGPAWRIGLAARGIDIRLPRIIPQRKRGLGGTVLRRLSRAPHTRDRPRPRLF